MSIRSKTVHQLFEVVKKELETVSAKAFEVHQKNDAKKQEALLAYKKLQLIRAGKSLTPEALKALQKATELKPPVVDTAFLGDVVAKDTAATFSDKAHLNDIGVFLASQREYQELLERYNPGLTMEQSDKVKRTANRVGLEIPE